MIRLSFLLNYYDDLQQTIIFNELLFRLSKSTSIILFMSLNILSVRYYFCLVRYRFCLVRYRLFIRYLSVSVRYLFVSVRCLQLFNLLYHNHMFCCATKVQLFQVLQISSPKILCPHKIILLHKV